MKKIQYIISILFFIFIFSQELFAAVTITSVTGTNGDLIGGVRYYRASTAAGGISYTFSISVTDPNATLWTQWSPVQLTIGGIGVDFEADVTGGLGGAPVTVNSGNVTVTANVTGTDYTDFTVTYTVYFDWDATEFASGVRTLTAFAESNNLIDGLTSDTDNATTVTGGVVSSAKVIIAQGGTAADGYVNPWDAAFAITGDVVYNVATAGAGDTIPAADISTNPELVYNIGMGDVFTGNTDANTDTALSFTVAAEWFAGNGEANDGIGTYEWKVRLTLPDGLQTITSNGPLTLVCDKIEIYDVQFQNGSGTNPALDTYNRNIYISGTQICIWGRMQGGGGTIPGGTTVDITYNYGVSGLRTTTVTIPAASNASNWVMIENPVVADVGGAGNTLTFNTYSVSNITGGGVYSGGTGQNAAARITQPASDTIYWDNADPPGVNTDDPFTTWVSTSSTADTITLQWTALPAGGADGDFSSYRIYFKPNASTTWNMIDRNTAGYATLGNAATAQAIINNLQPLTQYQYYVTAIDVFGNEVPASRSANGSAPADFDTKGTTPATIEITISDGISRYEDVSFTNDAAPAARPMRVTAIRVEAYLVAGDAQPEELNLILTDNAAGDLYPLASFIGTYYRIPFMKNGANSWLAFIPSDNPLVAVGSDAKFIIEAIRGGTTVYFDHDSELEVAPGDPNDYEWTFSITTDPNFTPWPFKVFNNVLTRNSRIAYPAYYLTDDAYVTIKVYDVKGRLVAVVLDRAYRKGGRNIKDQGWSGKNKSRRKVGLGLYYMHIKAKRASDGKVILNKFKKVVMAY